MRLHNKNLVFVTPVQPSLVVLVALVIFNCLEEISGHTILH